MIGPGNIFSASRIATEVKLRPAGLMMMPAPSSIASWIQPTISPSQFDWRNSSGCAAGRLAAHRLDLGERGVAVDLGLALAEPVQVRAVQDVDRAVHARLSQPW